MVRQPRRDLAGVPVIDDPLGSNLDALADAFAAIEDDGGTASHILASPTAWAALRKMKTGDGSAESLLGAGTADAAPRLFGVEVIRTPAVPSGQLLVLDRTAIVSAVGEVEVATSEHAMFRNYAVALRCTFRFGQALMRPARTALLTVGEVG